MRKINLKIEHNEKDQYVQVFINNVFIIKDYWHHPENAYDQFNALQNKDIQMKIIYLYLSEYAAKEEIYDLMFAITSETDFYNNYYQLLAEKSTINP